MRKREKYDNEVKEVDPETAVEEAEEVEEEGGNRAGNREMKNVQVKEIKSVQVGTELPSFPLVAQDQNIFNHRTGDRISKLPDDILVDILSNLELREAAKTSVLSRRWLNLWTLVPRLCFDAKKDQRKLRYRAVFVNWVCHVLGLHKSSYLREFRIFYQLDSCHQNEIDNWVEYAFGRGVESLELNFSRSRFFSASPWDYYSLINELLERIAPKVCFDRVRALCFYFVNISREAIEFLLRKCPLLEDLRVSGSNMLVNLVVSGPSLLLKHLEIAGCWKFESITISDTNIVSLRVTTTTYAGRLLLNNLPMLTDVWIFDVFSNKSALFSQFSCCLSQLTVLTLETSYPENIMEIDNFPELRNLRRLVLAIAYCGDRSMIGLTCLIDLCPRLEEFALTLDSGYAYWLRMEEKKAMEQSPKGLKVFELYGYRGRNPNESELIMFFIENVVALEKIIIDPRKVAIHHGSEPVETEQTKEYRKNAIEKFKGVVPKHVQLVIL